VASPAELGEIHDIMAAFTADYLHGDVRSR